MTKKRVKVMNELEKIKTQVLKFRDDRNWQQFHNPKDLALSLSLEASELLELFQWKSNEEAIEENLEEMKEELADIVIYSILFADKLEFDLKEIIENKLALNNIKYPVALSKNSKKKYTDLL